MEMVQRGLKTLAAASVELGVSYRQAERIYQRYRDGGDDALVHGNQGRPSNHKTDKGIIERALRLYRKTYHDFGPTLSAEKMRERDGLEIGVGVLRRALIQAGEWEPSKNTVQYRSRRAPRKRFGELVQFDGSPHDWFEGRSSRRCLITMIDDAKKERLSQFFEEETMFGAMSVLKMWIERYGVPESLYRDHKNAFVLTREASGAELLKGITKPLSHSGRACRKLGIEVLAANSPQAKGRVERNHGADRDRLVKELRLESISTLAGANRFLPGSYLPRMNARFGRPAPSDEDARVSPDGFNLDDILCMEDKRKVSNDYIVRFHARLFQILPGARVKPRPGDTVVVRTKLDASIAIIWKDKPLLVKEVNTLFDRCK
jgi:hypothetical protein